MDSSDQDNMSCTIRKQRRVRHSQESCCSFCFQYIELTLNQRLLSVFAVYTPVALKLGGFSVEKVLISNRAEHNSPYLKETFVWQKLSARLVKELLTQRLLHVGQELRFFNG